MKYLLDTNVCIVYMNGRAPSVRDHIGRIQSDDIVVCSVVIAELFYGAMKSRDVSSTLAKQRAFLAPYRSLPFDDNATLSYGKLRAVLEGLGKPIGGNDMLIAAIALSNNLTLVTHNCREFERIAGLKVADWE